MLALVGFDTRARKLLSDEVFRIPGVQPTTKIVSENVALAVEFGRYDVIMVVVTKTILLMKARKMVETYKRSSMTIRGELRKLVTETEPQLRVAIETRNANGKRVSLGAGVVSGWKQPFAIVYLDDCQWEFAWATIAKAVNDRTSLLV